MHFKQVMIFTMNLNRRDLRLFFRLNVFYGLLMGVSRFAFTLIPDIFRINPNIARVPLDFALLFYNFNDMKAQFGFDKKYKVYRCRFVA